MGSGAGVLGGAMRDTAEEAPRFGWHLRRLHEAAGLTQEELATRAGMSTNTIAALERGRRQRPHPPTVRALAAALDLSEEGRAELAALAAARGDAPVPSVGASGIWRRWGRCSGVGRDW